MHETSSKNVFAARHERLFRALEEARLDGMVLNAGPTLTYLTGLHFHLSERPVVVVFMPGRPPLIVLPELEAGKVDNLPFETKHVTYGEDPSSWSQAFQLAASTALLHGARLGIEPKRLRVLELRWLEGAATKADFVSADKVIPALRMVKEAGEIESMQKAVDIAQKALQAALPAAQVGITEREFAAELTLQILRAGSDPEMPFSPIVASGPNSANPHAAPTTRPFADGDLLIIDWGAGYQGYFSDLTRTFVFGQPDEEQARMAAVVAEANEAGQSAAHPGAAAGDIDRAARSVIEAAGYGEYFIHRTGHGLGLEGHEEPYLFSGNRLQLQPGVTFTVEPGIYLPGRGGVRIEDDIVITLNGSRSLSDMTRRLVSLG